MDTGKLEDTYSEQWAEQRQHRVVGVLEDLV